MRFFAGPTIATSIKLQFSAAGFWTVNIVQIDFLSHLFKIRLYIVTFLDIKKPKREYVRDASDSVNHLSCFLSPEKH